MPSIEVPPIFTQRFYLITQNSYEPKKHNLKTTLKSVNVFLVPKVTIYFEGPSEEDIKSALKVVFSLPIIDVFIQRWEMRTRVMTTRPGEGCFSKIRVSTTTSTTRRSG